MNQDSQVSESILDPTPRLSAGAFLRRTFLTLGLIPLLASIALAQSTITTYAGNGMSGFVGDGGPATSARLLDPAGLALDGAGNLYIADRRNNRVRKVTPGGLITTVAGDGRQDLGPFGDGGPATSARIWNPSAVLLDSAGNLFIGPCNEWRIRKVTTDGIINSLGSNSVQLLLLGCDYNYLFPDPTLSMAIDASGNLFVAEPHAQLISKINPEGVITTVAGTGTRDFSGNGRGFSGDGGPATSARLNTPSSVALDAAGDLLVADTYNHRIRKITPDGIITTVAGTGINGFSGDGGPATSAAIGYPNCVAIDFAGNVYIAEALRIRKVTPDGIITTVAGTGNYGFSGDGGPATSAQFNFITGIAVDAAGDLFVSDSGNQRIRKITFQHPTLVAVSRDLGTPGTTFSIALHGKNFLAPLTLAAGTGITVDDVLVTSETTATARLTIAPDAALGPREVTVTTLQGRSNGLTFTVVPPFPDLSVMSSPGRLGVGFDAVFTIDVQNVGGLDTSRPVTLTDTLPAGLTYVSGVGEGWSCSSESQTVTCGHDAPLAAGASTSISLTVAVGEAAAAAITHEVSVAVAGDAISSNNSAADEIVVATPAPSLRFFPAIPVAGRQVELGITLPVSFPYDVSGNLQLTFTPDAVHPADDPAVQFDSGGRELTFVIPANSVEARFGGNAQTGPVGFQTGTVAGTLVFAGVLRTGVVQTPLSTTLTIPRHAPVIERIQIDTANGLEGRVMLSSTPREVTQMVLEFVTQPAARLSCGWAAGCLASNSTLTLDVKSLFDAWYIGDKTFGGLSTLRFPLSIQGSVRGSVIVTLRNSQGASNRMSFPLPASR